MKLVDFNRWILRALRQGRVVACAETSQNDRLLVARRLHNQTTLKILSPTVTGTLMKVIDLFNPHVVIKASFEVLLFGILRIIRVSGCPFPNYGS